MKDSVIRARLPEMIEKAHKMQRQHAEAPISGHKNGACVLAENRNGVNDTFEGCNIELSTSTIIHAERLALFNAIMHGFIKPLAVIAPEGNNHTKVPMCGYCRQDYMYLNPDMKVFTVDHAGKVTGEFILRETLTNPYLSKSKIK